ncbi:MAG: ATP-dependent Clp protease ATP-binding subunit [Ktedonobacteraceae bacterium]|nr:ATP-dependent Clp protease ATP-binding subunit [Ktedonobacteraceae bacterium]
MKGKAMIHLCDSLTKRTSNLLEGARQEAKSRRHLYVGPEHLLLVLLAESGGLTPKIFSHLGVDLQEIHQAVETTLIRQESEIGVIKRIRMHLPTPIKASRLLSPPRKRLNRRAKGVMTRARGEASALHHRYVGTEHVLLSLVYEDAGAMSQLLTERGLSREGIRQVVTSLLV